MVKQRILGEFFFIISCQYSRNFCSEVIKWLDNQGVKIHLSEKDILFGILRCKDELIVHHTFN